MFLYGKKEKQCLKKYQIECVAAANRFSKCKQMVICLENGGSGKRAAQEGDPGDDLVGIVPGAG